MTRQGAIRLVVPRGDESLAQALGFIWDPAVQAWFAPATLPKAAYATWLPPTPAENLRADNFGLVRADTHCPACTAPMPAYCILLPAGHQSQDDPWAPWVTSEAGARIHYLVHLAEPAAARIQQIAPDYRPGAIQDPPGAIWQNHCPHCRAVNPDFSLHVASQGAFVPHTGAARKMQLYRINQPFVGHVRGYAWGISMLPGTFAS